jgi:hypothetical protein
LLVTVRAAKHVKQNVLEGINAAIFTLYLGDGY